MRDAVSAARRAPWVGLIFLIDAGLVGGFIAAAQHRPPVAAGVTWVLVITTSVVVHEAAHAAAALATGSRVRNVRVGIGPRLTPRSWWFELRLVPTSGQVRWEPRGGKPTRMLVTAAGLCAHALAIGAAARQPTAGHGTWLAILVINLEMVLGNTLARPRPGHVPDGRRLIWILQGRDTGTPLPERPSAPDGPSRDLVWATAAGGAAAAEPLLAHYPEPAAHEIRRGLAEAMADQGRWQVACDVAYGPGEKAVIPLTYADLAGTARLIRCDTTTDTRIKTALREARAAVPDLTSLRLRSPVTRVEAVLALADCDAETALRLADPSLAALLGRARDTSGLLATRGLALLALGHLAEAESVLRDAQEHGTTPLARLLTHRLSTTVAAAFAAAFAAGAESGLTYLADHPQLAGAAGRLALAEALCGCDRYEAAALTLRDCPPVSTAMSWRLDHARAEVAAMAMLTGSKVDPVRVATAASRAASAERSPAAQVEPLVRSMVTHTLSLVRLLQGQTTEAAALATAALDGVPTDNRADVLATRGLIALAEGDTDGARRALDTAGVAGSGPLVRLLAADLATSASTGR